MTTEFKFPDVGEGITEGKLVEWKVKEGDTIKTDDAVASVETDKAVVDIPAPTSGTVEKLLFKDGDTLTVGEVIMEIGEGGSAPAPETPKEEPKAEVVTSTAPAVSEEKKVVEAEVVKEEPKVQAPETVKTSAPAPISGDEVLAMPAVRHEANLKGIDLSTIKGSGKNGQILMEDLTGGSPTPKVEESKVIESGEVKVDISESQLKIGELPIAKEKEEVVIPDHIKENMQEIDVSDMKKNEVETENVSEKPAEIEKESKDNTVTSAPKNILASPTVRNLARELEVDINFVLGSGENGKVTEDDIKRAKENQDKHSGNGAKTEVVTSIAPVVKEEPKLEDKPNFEIKEEVKAPEEKKATPAVNLESKPSAQTLTQDMKVPFTSIRSIISKRMMESLQKSAQVTLSDEANITELVKIRNEQKERLKTSGVKLSFVSFFIKAYSEAVKEFPYFNATVDDGANEIVLKSEVNCGLAVDTPKGLLVPVIKGSDTKSIIDLSKSIDDLATRGREGKIDPSEMSGSTFTISSVGSLSGQVFTPILNYPEVALLGIGRISKKPIVVSDELGDKINIGDMVTLSLTFDHRAVDGADAARFLKKIIELLENPDLLFMEA